MSATCLCGNAACRGSFLHFVRADHYQKVLSETNAIAVRFANLLKSCMKASTRDLQPADSDILKEHGFGCAAFGAVTYFKDEDGTEVNSLDRVPTWLKMYIASVLQYIEHERKALPISLLCDSRERLRKRREKVRAGKRTKPAYLEPASKKPGASDLGTGQHLRACFEKARTGQHLRARFVVSITIQFFFCPPPNPPNRRRSCLPPASRRRTRRAPSPTTARS